MFPTIPSYLKPILTNLAKGGIGAVLVVLIWGYTSWRGENRLDYRYQIEKLERREDVHIATITRLQNTLTDKDEQISFLNNMRVDSPLAEWGKSLSGNYMFKDTEFDDWFVISNGLDPDSVIGKNDLEIWPDSDLAKSYMDVDKEVLRTGRTLHSTEYARVDGEVVPIHSIKYVIRHNSLHFPLGTGGLAILKSDVCKD